MPNDANTRVLTQLATLLSTALLVASSGAPEGLNSLLRSNGGAASQQGLHEESEASTAKLSRKKPAALTSHTLAPAQLDCRSGQAVQLADPAFAALEPGQQGVQVTEPSESV